MRAMIFAATLVAASLLGGPRASAMHCQQRLVLVGDSSARIQSLCGDPTDVAHRVETRSRTIERMTPYGIVFDTVSETVTIEVWTYDLGPNRFMQRLLFLDGRLNQMETLGYGTVEGHERR